MQLTRREWHVAVVGGLLAGSRPIGGAAQAGNWRPLFDGSSTSAWRGYKSDAMPSGWRVADGLLSKDVAVPDIISREQFGDFELELDWRIGAAGNSGIFYRGTEEYNRIYWSAPEYQLLDDEKAADNKTRLTCAGASYALYPSPAGFMFAWRATPIPTRPDARLCYNTAFTVDKNFVYWLNLTLRHYGQGDYAKAIYFNNANDNLVQGNTFALNDLGIGFKRDSHRNVVQDNEFYDTDFLWPWDAVKAGSNLETGGVGFYSPTTGRGNNIRRNTFHDYFDGFTTCPEDNGATTNETDAYENLVYNTGDDGLSADGACSNVRLWRNTFHDVLVGISLAPIYEGPIYALRNLIYRTDAGNNGYPGLPFKFNSCYPQSGRMYLFHHTADAVLPGNNGFDIKSPGSWQLIYARNNIWVAILEGDHGGFVCAMQQVGIRASAQDTALIHQHGVQSIQQTRRSGTQAGTSTRASQGLPVRPTFR